MSHVPEYGWIGHHADLSPDRVALIDDGRDLSMTYGEPARRLVGRTGSRATGSRSWPATPPTSSRRCSRVRNSRRFSSPSTGG
jgi:hypothetical protein